MRRTMLCLLLCTGVFAVTAPAWAGSHLWVIQEVFSNSDGTVQFVELYQPTSSCCEIVLDGKYVRSVTTTNQYDFPANLTGDTAFKSLLLATADFAALPGAPTPDYIIPDGFFSTGSDTIEYYVYHEVSFPAASSPALPLDGINSLHFDPSGVGTVAQNSPTNFADETGSVDASAPSQPPADLTYNDEAPTYFVGVAIPANTPNWTGGTPDSFSIDLPLVAGLIFDTGTGWITGTPMSAAPETVYTVTATNTLGSTNATIAITIELSSPDPAFIRSDSNQDGSVDIGDALGILGYLFQSQPISCTLALDSNDDGLANLADAIHLLAYLFSGGPEPSAPFGACGLDPTAGGSLDCVEHSACP